MIDVAACRAARPWSRRETTARVLWACAQPLFRLSPRPLWGWRRLMLRTFGARVDAGAHVHPAARVSMPWNVTLGSMSAVGEGARLYALGPVRIGARATVSQGAHLCAGTHDLDDPARSLVKAPVAIGRDAWVCAEAFVGPGVSVGDGAVVGARAVIVRDVAPRDRVAGNPARSIRRGAWT